MTATKPRLGHEKSAVEFEERLCGCCCEGDLTESRLLFHLGGVCGAGKRFDDVTSLLTLSSQDDDVTRAPSPSIGSGGTISLSCPGTWVTVGGSSKPLAVVLGLGGGTGAFGAVLCCSWNCFCCASLCCFNFFTSSAVNNTVDVLPPKNFSQPGASVKTK